MSTPTKPVKTSSRPLRALLLLAIIFVGLIGTVLIQGSTSVRLGLDLRGGTSVTLQPRASNDSNKGRQLNYVLDKFSLNHLPSVVLGQILRLRLLA